MTRQNCEKSTYICSLISDVLLVIAALTTVVKIGIFDSAFFNVFCQANFSIFFLFTLCPKNLSCLISRSSSLTSVFNVEISPLFAALLLRVRRRKHDLYLDFKIYFVAVVEILGLFAFTLLLPLLNLTAAFGTWSFFEIFTLNRLLLKHCRLCNFAFNLSVFMHRLEHSSHKYWNLGTPIP